jgi:hypothetical protein
MNGEYVHKPQPRPGKCHIFKSWNGFWYLNSNNVEDWVLADKARVHCITRNNVIRERNREILEASLGVLK